MGLPWTIFNSLPAKLTGRSAVAWLLAPVVALACMAVLPAATEDSENDSLALDRMTLIFNEDFNSLDVSPWGPHTRWIAHTPWSGDFGGARFTDPTKEFPFTIDDGILRITAARNARGEWGTGLLASMDPKGNGFANQYGYFEMRARLPVGPGLWPAFWLIGKDRSRYTAEIDILEFYGDRPVGYESTVHVWYRDGRHYSRNNRIGVFPNADPTDFHTYGARIDQDWIRFYFDRELVWKTETPEEHRQPMFILLNLALVNEKTKHAAPDPSSMYVDYVRAYAAD